MDQINANDSSRQQPNKKDPDPKVTQIRAEMDPFYRESGFTAPTGPDAKTYLDADGRRITDDVDYLDLDTEGEIPLPNVPDPLPKAKSAEFGALLHTNSVTLTPKPSPSWTRRATFSRTARARNSGAWTWS